MDLSLSLCRQLQSGYYYPNQVWIFHLSDKLQAPVIKTSGHWFWNLIPTKFHVVIDSPRNCSIQNQ